jgi:hypothetical protein
MSSELVQAKLMDRSSLLIRLIQPWRMSRWTAEKRRPTKLWIPSIGSQDGTPPVLLTPKSGSFNDWLAEMREKDQEKRRDEFFNEIKPMTLLKQEWRRKEAPHCLTAEPDADG